MEGILKIILSGKPDYIDVVKMSIGTMASKLGFDVEKIEEIEMAVAESCKLLVCHESDCWCAEYVVECFYEKKTLTIVMQDSDKGQIDKDGKKCCKDCPNEGELGAYVAESLVDSFQLLKLANGKQKIIISKDL